MQIKSMVSMFSEQELKESEEMSIAAFVLFNSNIPTPMESADYYADIKKSENYSQ